MKDFSDIHVLVIDDEPGICLSLTAFLEDYGFRASSAESAEDALALMGNTAIDICIVDLRLPGMSGEELIIEACTRHPGLRHIIYTGSTSYTLPEPLQALGMRPEHVFLKPIRVLTLLVKAIKALVEEPLEDEG